MVMKKIIVESPVNGNATVKIPNDSQFFRNQLFHLLRPTGEFGNHTGKI